MFNKAALWDLSYGIYIVSSMDNTRPTGCCANCAVQLTHNLIAVSINHTNYTNEVIKKNKGFAISILSEKSNREIISIFGFSSGRDRNKFDNIKYRTVNNLAIVEDSCAYITLKTVKEVEFDTHTLFIGEITDGDIINNDIPMTYKYYHDVIKGRAPKAAPTYIAPDDSIEEINNKKRFKCKICGYIYEGDINLEKDDFVCPVCKRPKSFFEEI